MLGNILVGAGVVWGLTTLVVCPVSRSLLRRRLHSPEFVRAHGGPASEAAAAELERLVNRCCIRTHLVVLGVAELASRFLGHWFAGALNKAGDLAGIVTSVGTKLIVAAARFNWPTSL
jgi:hypothetical protein